MHVISEQEQFPQIYLMADSWRFNSYAVSYIVDLGMILEL